MIRLEGASRNVEKDVPKENPLMPMTTAAPALPESTVPRAAFPVFQHLLDIYAGETRNVDPVGASFSEEDLPYRIHPKSSSVQDVLGHQLVAERRFFGEFLGSAEPAAEDVAPKEPTVAAFRRRLGGPARSRLAVLASCGEAWWISLAPFFDVIRERIWIFWRRVLHPAHRRTPLAVALRLLGKPVPPIDGPTADVIWTGADPTMTSAAARRKGGG